MASTSTRTAANDGTCQICGCRQRLPLGRMAKHGYDVRFGFFNGTCPGSDNLPYQQSVNLILDSIARVRASAEKLRQDAAAQRAITTGSKTMVSVYLQATWKDRTSRHEWQEVEILTEDRGTHLNFTYIAVGRTQNGHPEPKTKRWDDCRHQTLEQVVAAGRAQYAQHLEAKAAQLDGYAEWQTERLASWKPTDLLPRLR